MRKVLFVMGYMVTLPVALVFSIVYGLTVFTRAYKTGFCLAWEKGHKSVFKGGMKAARLAESKPLQPWQN